MNQTAIPGYTYGDPTVAPSPLNLEELELLKKTVLFTDEDVAYLKMSGDILANQTDAILDVWYGFVASQPQLLYYFSRKTDGQANGDYLGAVRKRFAQWILDTAAANYDQTWLDYQHEIGRRHHRVAKNTTDHVDAVEHIHYRYLMALLYPVTATLKPFLAQGGHRADEVDKMHQAWIKSVLLQLILWSHPYIKAGDF